jgi:hypothetical protein
MPRGELLDIVCRRRTPVVGVRRRTRGRPLRQSRAAQGAAERLRGLPLARPHQRQAEVQGHHLEPAHDHAQHLLRLGDRERLHHVPAVHLPAGHGRLLRAAPGGPPELRPAPPAEAPRDHQVPGGRVRRPVPQGPGPAAARRVGGARLPRPGDGPQCGSWPVRLLLRAAQAGVLLPSGLRGTEVAQPAQRGSNPRPAAGGHHQGQQVPKRLDQLRRAG